MNLYSNKQKWKIALLIFALLLVGASLFVSNQIVSKVGAREKERATQWADAIKKKVELVQLTNNTFSKLRDNERRKMELWIEATKEISKATNLSGNQNYDFPLSIIQENTDIPVIVVDNERMISGSRNLDFDTSIFRQQHPDYTKQQISELFDDSLLALSDAWRQKNPSFTIEVFEGLFMTYIYNDSKEIERLESDRDSLIESFNEDLIKNNELVPVMLVNPKTGKVLKTNIESKDKESDFFNKRMAEMKAVNKPITLDFQGGEKNLLYYDNSPELKQLQYFPYIQFILIGLFALIGYIIFSTFRKAEQNQVWAGMAKETAHQLGTPLSSLMAWVQLLEAQGIDPMATSEMQKDINRLEKVTDRFSKIGSGASLKSGDISTTVRNVVEYLKPRISNKVEFTLDAPENVMANHNESLIEWVIENICKNAVDAMEAQGTLHVSMTTVPEWVHIDITDSGKGIPPHQLKTIFQPGFSTKKRGWGLGLSLVRRIVNDYHKGKVHVLSSQIDVGTTFRISIPLS
ncbi:MAG: HAMP domain-containing histidine kinase [Crocinitomicaceae bacterium]|nr:HAMP domain-containing histidine kinase [Crocinitomicaceae bacterium]